jgi:branched-subunit amino acid permease
MQPYFPAGPNTRPAWFETIGNMFHPLSTAVLPVSLFLSVILFIRTLRRQEDAASAWAVVIAWLLILEALLLFVGYHGDFYSKNRHVVVPLMQMRLSAWLVIFIVTDFVFVDFSPKFLYNELNNYIGKPAKSSKPA